MAPTRGEVLRGVDVRTRAGDGCRRDGELQLEREIGRRASHKLSDAHAEKRSFKERKW